MRAIAIHGVWLLILLAVPAAAPGADLRTGLDIGIRGGWYFQLNQPAQDSVLDRGRVSPGGSLGVDAEVGPSFGDHVSVLIRFGYQSRLEQWESPSPGDIEDMKLVHSLVHLPSVNLKLRPWLKRFSLYFTVGGGLDLVVWEPSFGVGESARIRQPGAGVNLGLGGELFVTRKFSIALDVRDHLALHAAESLRIEDADSGEPYYDLTFQPLLHVLNLYLGVGFYL